MLARSLPVDSSARGGSVALRLVLEIGLALALGVAVSLCTAPARARDREPAGPLLYEVAGECPSRALWLESLRARLPPLLRTHPAIDELAVHVVRDAPPAAGDETFSGEIESSIGAQPEGSRQVHGQSCEDVLEALTFIAALSLERSVGARAEGPDAGAGADTDAQLPLLPAPSDAPGADRSSSAVSGVRDLRRPRFGALGFASLEGAIAPRPALDWGIGISVGWQTPDFQPWFLAGVYFGSVEEARVPGSTAYARFEHWASHLVGCPWRFPSVGVWGLRPCAELDVGRSSGQGRGVLAAERHVAPWLSTGAELRFELALWDRVQLGAAGGGVVPIWRSRFFFVPEVTAFQVPALGLRAETFASLLF